MTWPTSREGKFHRKWWHHVEDFQDNIVEQVEKKFCVGRKMMTRKRLRNKQILELTRHSVTNVDKPSDLTYSYENLSTLPAYSKYS